MNGPVRRWLDHYDLWLTALAAALAPLAVAADAATVARTLVALPLVLFLPGYVLVSALLPALMVPTVERLLLAAGSSIALTVLTGFLLAAGGFELNPLTWSLALSATTVILGTLAWLRRIRHGVTGPRLSPARMPRLGAALVLIAAIATVDIILGARLLAGAQQTPAPTQLWLVPVAGRPTEARLGVRDGPDEVAYRLVLSSTDRILHEFVLELEPEEVWETIVRFSDGDRARPIVAQLYEGSSTNASRQVVLSPSTNTSSMRRDGG